MQTRFQIREIDLSKGYCLLVTDKNHTRVTFGFDDLETQVQRLEKFLVYCDDSKQELATVNLMVQRNIPVTFTKSAVDVINETVRPDEAPRPMKGIPPHDAHRNLEPFQRRNRSARLRQSLRRNRALPPVRRAIPVNQPRKEKSNGQ